MESVGVSDCVTGKWLMENGEGIMLGVCKDLEICCMTYQGNFSASREQDLIVEYVPDTFCTT